MNTILLNEIKQLMKEINENADDTVWLNDHETIFERLSSIYLDNGGEFDELKKTFPENF